MQIDREQIVTFLQGEGNLDTAQQALSSLPQTIDTSEQAQLLEQIGIDPTQLIESLGLTEQLDGVTTGIGQYQDTISSFTEGGAGGIIDKIKEFIGNRI